jgi:hypothetical protein
LRLEIVVFKAITQIQQSSMEMGEEGKYSPGLAAMDVESLEGAAKAAQNL